MQGPSLSVSDIIRFCLLDLFFMEELFYGIHVFFIADRSEKGLSAKSNIRTTKNFIVEERLKSNLPDGMKSAIIYMSAGLPTIVVSRGSVQTMTSVSGYGQIRGSQIIDINLAPHRGA